MEQVIFIFKSVVISAMILVQLVSFNFIGGRVEDITDEMIKKKQNVMQAFAIKVISYISDLTTLVAIVCLSEISDVHDVIILVAYGLLMLKIIGFVVCYIGVVKKGIKKWKK